VTTLILHKSECFFTALHTTQNNNISVLVGSQTIKDNINVFWSVYKLI